MDEQPRKVAVRAARPFRPFGIPKDTQLQRKARRKDCAAMP
jgi:hypothetical protein